MCNEPHRPWEDACAAASWFSRRSVRSSAPDLPTLLRAQVSLPHSFHVREYCLSGWGVNGRVKSSLLVCKDVGNYATTVLGGENTFQLYLNGDGDRLLKGYFKPGADKPSVEDATHRPAFRHFVQEGFGFHILDTCPERANTSINRCNTASGAANVLQRTLIRR